MKPRDYFCGLYKKEFDWGTKLDDITFRVLDESSRRELERGFLKDAILESLLTCKRDKAPGPD